MSQILIYKEQVKINQEIALISKPIPYLQKAYNMFAGLGVSFSLGELADLIYSKHNYSATVKNGVNKLLQDRFVAKLLNTSTYQSFNNLPIAYDKKVEMIEIPDLRPVDNFLSAEIPNGLSLKEPIDVTHIQLINGIISKQPGADETIIARYTHYTKNKRGVQVVNTLNEFIEQFKAVSKTMGKTKFKSNFIELADLKLPGLIPIITPLDKPVHYQREGQFSLKHEEVTDFRIDVGFVRAQEALHG